LEWKTLMLQIWEKFQQAQGIFTWLKCGDKRSTNF
jgi:hypothetical protein